MNSLERRVRAAVSGGPLEGGLSAGADLFFEHCGNDPAATSIDERVLAGLARVVATSPDTARFIAHRPELFRRIATAGPVSLDARRSQIDGAVGAWETEDLEDFLDALRLLRREETALAACLEFGGLIPPSELAVHLSFVAENVVQRALARSRREARGGGGERSFAGDFAVIGMGKIAGCEFTVHSDLDLIFLYDGGPEEVTGASRIGQRLTAYLTTTTGAGIAYPVDTRLRPSGQQGMLVTSFRGFEAYQRERAETWEHLALLRSRPIAGSLERTKEVLDRVRGDNVTEAGSPWRDVIEMRDRVVSERGAERGGRIALKAGRGGIMDAEFIAAAALLERGVAGALPERPSVPAMLRAAGVENPSQPLLAAYAELRRVEARARWVAGRAVETLHGEDPSLAVVAELVEPGLAQASLLERVAAARATIASVWETIAAAGTIAAVERAA